MDSKTIKDAWRTLANESAAIWREAWQTPADSPERAAYREVRTAARAALRALQAVEAVDEGER